MRNKRAAILVVSVSILVVVFVAACIVAAPALVDAIRAMHVIPHH
jgi:hypothetical protein